jgi:hypothetical protein
MQVMHVEKTKKHNIPVESHIDIDLSVGRGID